MEEADGRSAKQSSTTCTGPASPEAHGEREDTRLRRPNTFSTLSTETAVEPRSDHDSIEPETRSRPPEQNAEAPTTAVQVPRAQRRGLFPQTTILAEIADPYQYSDKTKWFITVVVAYAAAAAPVGSAILFRMLWSVCSKLRFH